MEFYRWFKDKADKELQEAVNKNVDLGFTKRKKSPRFICCLFSTKINKNNLVVNGSYMGVCIGNNYFNYF